MKLTFLGAAHEVTGSCTLLEACGRKFVVDCGMEQGADTYENRELPVKASEIDAVFLTHAHLDHSGHIPILVKEGFTGTIYATAATAQLCDIMLKDSAHIQEQDAEWRNRKAKRSGGPLYEPPYVLDDVLQTLGQFEGLRYGEQREVTDGVSVRFLDAGHLLGSSSIELTVTENGETRVLLFSGDVGNTGKPMVSDPQKPEKADIVVIESTYGDRDHGAVKDYEGQFVRVLQKTLDRGGTLVIPAFAIGRTQEMLYLLHEIKRKGLVKGHDGFPVWLDSPLAIEATGIYAGSLAGFYDDEMNALIASGQNPLKFDDLRLSVTANDSKALNYDETPKVIISASGMCEAGRIRHHLKHNLWKKECTVLFVGYQSPGTIGRMLLDGVDSVKLFSEKIRVEASIEQMDGISGHADRGMLLGWLGNIKEKPTRVFVNHGDDEVVEAFARQVRDELGLDAVAPYSGGCYDLLTGECLDEGNRELLDKKKRAAAQTGTVFGALVLAGERLLALIRRSEGRPNKDLQRFRSEVDSLHDRWDN